MKVCIIQPPYYTDYSRSDECFRFELEALDKCGDDLDLIVMPESCDVPSLAHSNEEAANSVARYNRIFLDKVSETAKRCHAMIFVNARSFSEGGIRNTTYAFDRNGHIAGQYFKQHLTPGEVTKLRLDSDYSFEFSEPTVLR